MCILCDVIVYLKMIRKYIKTRKIKGERIAWTEYRYRMIIIDYY